MSMLFWMAVIPPLYMLFKVYTMDKVEKEPPRLIWKLLIAGALTTIPAGILEQVFGFLSSWTPNVVLSALIENFLVVAVIEEGVKFLALRYVTWRDPNFNYTFDGVVYAVTVSLGFALAENVMYVAMFGIGTAVIRAFTAIVLHGVCGVFLGIYYGGARKLAAAGQASQAKAFLTRGYFVAVFIHGLYDFCASINTAASLLAFYALLAVLYFITYRRLVAFQQTDTRIDEFGPSGFGR